MKIAKKGRDANIFAIIADETPNISPHEQIAIVLRHVNDNLETHKSFVCFIVLKKLIANH